MKTLSEVSSQQNIQVFFFSRKKYLEEFFLSINYCRKFLDFPKRLNSELVLSKIILIIKKIHSFQRLEPETFKNLF